MTKLLLLLIAISLQAKTLYILETDDLVGKCTIEKGDIVIVPHYFNVAIPRGITVIECSNEKCVRYEVARIKHLYRTNGIGEEIIK